MEIVYIILALCLGVIIGFLFAKNKLLSLHISELSEKENQIILLEEKIKNEVETKLSYKSRSEEYELKINELRDSKNEVEKELSSSKEKNKLLPEIQNRFDELNKKYELKIDTINSLEKQLAETRTTLEEERKSAKEKLVILEEAKENLRREFENISNRIFDDKSEKFILQNKQNLDTILTPFKDQITDFKKKVEDVYDKESKDRRSLQDEIKNLKELNVQISKDAINLTNALKSDPRKQGAWGEIVLEKVLEESGLRKGHEYETQVSFSDDEGNRKRPDAIVRLPDGKDVIIDSKLTLVAYETYYNSDDLEIKSSSLKEFIQNIRKHIQELAGKKYEELEEIRSLEYVLMFIPIESAFMLFIENDRSLYNEAFSKNIVIVSPTTLLVSLKTIHNIWRYEYQNMNARDIAKKAGDLYDKFCNFVESIEEIGKFIKKADEAYETALKRISTGRGNLISQAENIRNLGLKTKKTLPQQLLDNSEIPEEDILELPE